MSKTEVSAGCSEFSLFGSMMLSSPSLCGFPSVPVRVLISSAYKDISQMRFESTPMASFRFNHTLKVL